MHYQDFTIDLRSAEGGGLEAAVAKAPLDDFPCVPFAEPLTQDELDLVFAAFDLPGEALASSPLQVSPRAMGGKISAALFAGLGDFFRRCRDAVCRGGHDGLRLRLRFRADDPRAGYLAALPWEWLVDPDSGAFLATDLGTPVVREIAAARDRASLEVEEPLRILVVDAAPGTMKRLKLKLEIARMTEALGKLIDARQVELLRLESATPETMRDSLRDDDIHVLHFMGHAGYDPRSGTGAILFAKDDGTEDQVDGEMLAAFLKRIPSLRLVVLNACSTARHGELLGAAFNHGLAPAILQHTDVQAVVANQYSISDSAAVAFSGSFYGRIAAGDGADEAITEARLRSWPRSAEWATPVLFLTPPSAKIFTVRPPRRARPVIPRAVDGPVRLGVRSFDAWGGDMEQRNDQVLDLVSCFAGRYIKDKAWWQEKVFPELRGFLLRHIDPRRPLVLDFAAHSSIAFAAGWLLEPKSGLDVRVRQRIGNTGEFEWHPQDGSDVSDVKDASGAAAPLWQERPDVELDPGAADLAVALAVSQPAVADQVLEFVRREGLPVGRILDATIAPQPGARSVRGGAHSLRLAQALLPRLQVRQPHERAGRVHFFCAAPNALVFYLGQLSSTLGRVVLYEYPFRAEDAYGRYQKSIELPPPGEPARVPPGF